MVHRPAKRRSRTRPTAAKPSRTLLERAALAREIGVSARTIGDWRNEGLPQEPDGRYCLEEVREWRAANKRPSGRPGDIPEGAGVEAGELTKWIATKEKQKAIQEEMRTRQMAGQLIELDVVNRLAQRRITTAKELLEQLPDRIIGLLPRSIKAGVRRELRGRVAQMVDDALHALADAETEPIDGPDEEPREDT